MPDQSAPELPNYSPDPTLTPDQHHVLALLAEGRTLTDAAAAVGVHRNTIRNWRRAVPAFARESELAVREQALVWHEQSLRFAPRAAEVVEHTLNSPEISPSLRLRAALAVLKTAANPQPRPLPLMNTFSGEIEAARGQSLARQALVRQGLTREGVQKRISEIMHNHAQPTPIRRPVEPSRNSVCPCKSGLKFKRCCGSATPLAQAA